MGSSSFGKTPAVNYLNLLNSIREWLKRKVLGAEYELLQLGRFRTGGEIHLWMYHRYSLAKLLTEAGFVDLQSTGPRESQVSGWTDYNLDTEPDGSVYKPYSLYMEAVRL